MFKPHWWRRYRTLPAEIASPDLSTWEASLDCTFKGVKQAVKGKLPDFVVLQVWSRRGANRYLVKQFRGRFGLVDTCALVVKAKREFPQLGSIFIEDTANGPGVVDALRDVVEGLIPVSTGTRSKPERASAVTPIVEAHNCWIPESNGLAPYPWETDQHTDPVVDFVHEHQVFPKGKNDDQVDATALYLGRTRIPAQSVVLEEIVRMRHTSGDETTM